MEPINQTMPIAQPCPPRINLLGVPLTLIDQPTLLAALGRAVRQGEKTLVLSGNIYAYNLAYEQPWLKAFFQRATIVRIDGAGVRLGARLQGHPTPPRMTWADLMWDLAAWAVEQDISLYFVGSKPGVADKAAQRLQERYPALRIVGTHHGYFDKTPDHPETKAVLAAINQARPDIVIVGFGMRLQERWLSHAWDQLEVPVTMTAGAAFDYTAGTLQRGSPLLTKYGFEWLARLLIEPKRLWRRYIIGNPLFVWRVLSERFRQNS